MIKRRQQRQTRYAAAAVVGIAACSALFAPALAPTPASEQFQNYPYAPPMRLHITDEHGRLRSPFVYPLALSDRLERAYLEDRANPLPIRWFTDGKLVSSPSRQHPLLLLGADALGRDVWSRLLYGGRISLGLALVATMGAAIIGVLVGAVAGYAGGWIDEIAMRTTDLVLVLPVIYVVLALRAVLPLVLTSAQVFTGLTIVFMLVGWPSIARGVRAIINVERRKGYAEAARAAGNSAARVLVVHLLPATRGFLLTQAALLVPAFVLAEATVSFAGFGFSEPVPSWGTMIQDASTSGVFREFPWLLAPAAAIAIVSIAGHTLAMNESDPL